MADKNRPRSKTATRSPSSGNLAKGRERTASRPETEPETVQSEPVENTLPWDLVDRNQITELLSLAPPKVLAKFCAILPAENPHIKLKSSIKADLYLLVVHFSQQNHLSDTQTGGLLTLFRHLISMILEGKQLVEVVFESSQLLACQKDFREGMRFDFYTPAQVIAITEYLKSTIFQHFKLYQFCLLQEQEETIVSLDKIVNTLPATGSFDPPPLAEAISDHDIEVYLNAPPSECEEGVAEKEAEVGEKKDDEKVESESLISLSAVQSVLDTVGVEMMDKLSKDMQAKCEEKEKHLMNRLSKVEKALD